MNKAIASAVPESAQEEADESYDKWRAKDDMRTILEAARIQKDAIRMKNVKRCAREEVAEVKAMQAMAGSK